MEENEDLQKTPVGVMGSKNLSLTSIAASEEFGEQSEQSVNTTPVKNVESVVDEGKRITKKTPTRNTEPQRSTPAVTVDSAKKQEKRSSKKTPNQKTETQESKSTSKLETTAVEASGSESSHKARRSSRRSSSTGPSTPKPLKSRRSSIAPTGSLSVDPSSLADVHENNTLPVADSNQATPKRPSSALSSSHPYEPTTPESYVDRTSPKKKTPPVARTPLRPGTASAHKRSRLHISFTAEDLVEDKDEEMLVDDQPSPTPSHMSMRSDRLGAKEV
jgi:hypothetical protein